jgi:hypothetical protein
VRRAAVLLLLASCASSPRTTASTGPSSDGDSNEPAGGEDASSADAGAEAALTDGCAAKRVATSAECAEDCDARLKLPAGGSYCTMQCAQSSDCTSLGAALLCPETIGACVPRCTGDDSCKAAGFRRCDLETGACDTL